ncbi:ubiquitin carboxyl-terminal hydrolase [Sansalvadorimonas sp. 2012CJ34-2]|uniref:Ubiquitin carboxyl-terminal hydrolase n=1 Tax=Parendozoicomonas callyspongiae TaxID=2942213 RepID=A0ABT0PJ43_9GAMM|nr:ubiquitin carboxyl-terminal hydrolase family protein [Sansalvadorimonas sp. 2012CJ34-2]MCL6271281.1 ubiquitin carboxyl-terminal hydrolase [Sansalvadorimonas sp. 2012CJ34-2]
MPAARYFLIFAIFFFLLAARAQGHSDTGQAIVDDPSYENTPELSTSNPGWYREYGSDTHLMLSKNSHLVFEDHKMVRHLGMVSVAAAFAALLGRVPDLMGYDTNSLAAKVMTTIPMLVWPAMTGKRTFEAISDNRFHTRRYPVRIVDHQSLANQLSIFFEYSIASQKIEIRSALQAFKQYSDRHELKTHKTTLQYPLVTLNQLINFLQIDRVELYWEGKFSPVELRFWLPDTTKVSIEIPQWGEILSARLKSQGLPALLSFFQPTGLNQINEVLTCFYQGSIGTGICPTGHLTPEFEDRSHIRLRYKPTGLYNLPLLKGKQVDHRFLVPLLPCKNNLCSMVLAWFSDIEKGSQSPLLTSSNEPLYLYARPTTLTQLSKSTPNLSKPVVRRVSPWLTDILTLLPYAAVYYGTDRLLLKGMGTIGIGPTQFTAGTGLFGAGWFGSGDGQKQGYGQGGITPPGRNVLGGLKDWLTGAVPLSPAEQAILKVLPGKFSKDVRFALVPTQTASLKNTGNSCFQDSVFSYMASSLTDDELNGILEGRYFAVNRSEAFRNTSNLVRRSFVELMRGLRNRLSPDELAELRNRFFINARDYAHAYSPGLQPLFGGQSALIQQDAHEFYMALQNILGIEVNAASHLQQQRHYVHLINGQEYPRITNEAAWQNITTIHFPREENVYKSHNIQDYSGLMSHRQTPEFLEGDEAVFVSAQELEDAGHRIPEGLGIGGTVPSYSSLRISHPNPSEITHLNFQAVLFEQIQVNPTTAALRKINAVSRHLLAGPGKDTLRVEVFSPDGSSQFINMRLNSVVMHSGSSMQGGHYTTATIKEGRVMLHDDIRNQVHEIVPTAGVSTSPVDTLLSYMHHTHKDPYLLNYVRADL